MQNLTEISQCLQRWHQKIFIGHAFAIQGVRALSCACFQKECIFSGALGLGVYSCACVCVCVCVVHPKIRWLVFGRKAGRGLFCTYQAVVQDLTLHSIGN